MFESVLVPLDGSDLAEAAAPEAAALARRIGAKLHLVRVHAPYPMPFAIDTGALVAPSDPKWDNHLLRRERAYLAVAARRLKRAAGRAIGVHLLTGFAPEAICECAAGLPAPVLVMSTHGRSGPSRMWLGSVADLVVRTAPCPVLLVRPGVATDSPEAPLPHRILVPLDGTAASETAIAPAVAMAALSSARIDLVSVVWDGSTSPLYWLAASPVATRRMQQIVDNEQRRMRDYLARIEARIHKLLPGAAVSSHVLRGDKPAEAIIETASMTHADTIAIASHGRGVSRLLLGSVIDKVVRGSHANLLIVRRTPKPPRRKAASRR